MIPDIIDFIDVLIEQGQKEKAIALIKALEARLEIAKIPQQNPSVQR